NLGNVRTGRGVAAHRCPRCLGPGRVRRLDVRPSALAERGAETGARPGTVLGRAITVASYAATSPRCGRRRVPPPWRMCQQTSFIATDRRGLSAVRDYTTACDSEVHRLKLRLLILRRRWPLKHQRWRLYGQELNWADTRQYGEAPSGSISHSTIVVDDLT